MKTPKYKLLKLKEVIARTGLSRSTIHRYRVLGTFPNPMPIGQRLVAWLETDIDKWLDKKIIEDRRLCNSKNKGILPGWK